jgi:hypothetical protein
MGYKSTLEMVVEAQNRSARVLAQVSKDVKKVGAATAQSTEQANVKLGKMVQMVRGAAAAYGIVLAKQMAEAGRASQAVEDSFKRLNANAGVLLKTMRGASGGLLDDTSLQKIANKLQAIGLSSAKMAEILQLSMKLAAQSGQDYLDVTQRLTQALITGETESFKTLGILVDSATALKTFASEHGRTEASLTKTEQAQAKVNEALRIGNERFGSVDTSKYRDSLKQTETAAQNVWDKITRGAYWAANDISKFLLTMGRGAEDIFTALGNIADAPVKALNALHAAAFGAQQPVAGLADKYRGLMVELDRVSGSPALVAGMIKSKEDAYSGLASQVERLAAAIAKTEAPRLQAEAAEKKLATIKDYWQALDDVQRLEIDTGKRKSAIDLAELDAARKKIAYMRDSGQVFDGMAAAWQAARSQDALGVIASQVERMRDAYQAIAGLTAEDAFRTLFGLGGKGKAPEPPKTRSGGGGAKRESQIPELEDARARAQIELDMVKGILSEAKAIEDQYALDVAALSRQGLTKKEMALATEELFIRKRIELLGLEAEATKQAEDEKRRAMEESARAMERSAAREASIVQQRAKAQRHAQRAYKKSLEDGIDLSAQALKIFATTQRMMNIIDAARQAALAIASFAAYDYGAGIMHVIAAGAFIKAAVTAGKHGGGGGGGGGVSAGGGGGGQPDSRFTAATTPQEQGGGNITINVHGFAGNEEKLGGEVVRLVNLAGQSGKKINGAAVSGSRREGY